MSSSQSISARLEQIEIRVHDLERAAAFFHAVFGLAPIHQDSGLQPRVQPTGTNLDRRLDACPRLPPAFGAANASTRRDDGGWRCA
jgi:catechol 2,3-dioxygenase-like lactoylglutathione lyase family enzyme